MSNEVAIVLGVFGIALGVYGLINAVIISIKINRIKKESIERKFKLLDELEYIEERLRIEDKEYRLASEIREEIYRLRSELWYEKDNRGTR